MAYTFGQILDRLYSIVTTGSNAQGNYVAIKPEVAASQLLDNIKATKTSWGLINLSKLSLMTFSGRNGAGACTATGLAIGDLLLSVMDIDVGGGLGNAGSSFEATVTVNDQIQQSSATDLSTSEFIALVYRP